MAKAKTTSTGNSKGGSSATRPQPKATQSPRPAKAAPDTPSMRPADGRASVNNAGSTAAKLSPEDVYRLIQESAYFKAKERGFAPGGEVQDWIEAEAEVRSRLEGRPS